MRGLASQSQSSAVNKSKLTPIRATMAHPVPRLSVKLCEERVFVSVFNHHVLLCKFQSRGLEFLDVRVTARVLETAINHRNFFLTSLSLRFSRGAVVRQRIAGSYFSPSTGVVQGDLLPVTSKNATHGCCNKLENAQSAIGQSNIQM